MTKILNPSQASYTATIQAAIRNRRHFWFFTESLWQELINQEPANILPTGNDILDGIARTVADKIQQDHKEGISGAIRDLERAYRQNEDFNQLLGDISND